MSMFIHLVYVFHLDSESMGGGLFLSIMIRSNTAIGTGAQWALYRCQWESRRPSLQSLIDEKHSFYWHLSNCRLCPWVQDQLKGSMEMRGHELSHLTDSGLVRGNVDWADPREVGNLETWPEGQCQSSNEHLWHDLQHNPSTPEGGILQDPRE